LRKRKRRRSGAGGAVCRGQAPASPAARPGARLHIDEVDDEHEGVVSRDQGRAAALRPVCQRRWDDQFPATAHLHSFEALREPGDHLVEREDGGWPPPLSRLESNVFPSSQIVPT
jgi:hypothetical protein